ncbi:hypothetical protein L6164_009870 [Bauhinia variegata]|uniref:Uncharacterized protein n=1 Tax=Bauhinia variegata TaxID=167791 RepID=A0ACB9PL49_BAUVA|nr:hypothetical protein L6164_009870 [Bauhinia variegata]
MEKFRHKRSKSANRTDRTSEAERALPAGNKQVQGQRKFSNFSSDSSSCGSGAADEDSYSSKPGWRSSKPTFGTPMKKLLAEEMTREPESKRRGPSVIARLMGLDGLPLQQHANKQHKGSSENQLQRTTQVDKTQSSGAFYDRRSRRSSRDSQEFKDVFEVSEMPKVESNRYSSQGSQDMKITEAEISFIEQKFTDAKRLVSDKDLQSSKEFNDAFEILDSNADLLLKYFQQPDSLFKKHLNDLDTAPLQSHCDHLETLQSSYTEKHEHSDFSWKSDRDTTQLNYNRSHQKQHDGFPRHFDRRHAVHSSPRSSKFQSKGKDEPDALPTRIVVLKPNLGKLQNATKIVPSPCPSHTFLERGKWEEFPDVRNRNYELHKSKHFPGSVRLPRQNSMESREIAREITRQMKNSLNCSSEIFSSSRFRGYAEDDSLGYSSENESQEDSEITTATLGNSFDLNNRRRPPSRSSESSVSGEAKKRLSERWKMTHKSQQVQTFSRGSTLADMLAIPDKEMKAANFDSVSGEVFQDKCASSSNGGPAGWAEPLGISSKDGWKEGCVRSLPRSRSLPASSTAFGSPRISDDRFMVLKETHKRDKKKSVKGFNSRSSRSGHKKSWSCHFTNMESDGSSPEMDTIRNKIKTSLEKEDVASLFSETEILKDTRAVTEDVVDVSRENAAGSSEPPDEVLQELSACVSIKGHTSTIEEDKSLHQEISAGSSNGNSVSFQPSAAGLESSCCKDADQPSPISVLEPSFADDLSSCSECFESLSADLQGLRMQLQELKLESEEYVEGPILVSSDEDAGEVSTGNSKENRLCRAEDNWESSYIINTLFESGIDRAHPDTFLEVWHSSECPVSPSVFDELEKRYSDLTTCPKSERKLLFDRINSGIVKIFHQVLNAQPWVNSPATTNIGSKLIENGLQDGLLTLLGPQAKVKDDALGKVLAKQSQWLDMGDDIDVIGRDVERLLLDDLVAEIARA